MVHAKTSHEPFIYRIVQSQGLAVRVTTVDKHDIYHISDVDINSEASPRPLMTIATTMKEVIQFAPFIDEPSVEPKVNQLQHVNDLVIAPLKSFKGLNLAGVPKIINAPSYVANPWNVCIYTACSFSRWVWAAVEAAVVAELPGVVGAMYNGDTIHIRDPLQTVV